MAQILVNFTFHSGVKRLLSARIAYALMPRPFPTSIRDAIRPAQLRSARDGFVEAGVDAPVGAAKDKAVQDTRPQAQVQTLSAAGLFKGASPRVELTLRAFVEAIGRGERERGRDQ
jgi:hypothetical protein